MFKKDRLGTGRRRFQCKILMFLHSKAPFLTRISFSAASPFTLSTRDLAVKSDYRYQQEVHLAILLLRVIQIRDWPKHSMCGPCTCLWITLEPIQSDDIRRTLWP